MPWRKLVSSAAAITVARLLVVSTSASKRSRFCKTLPSTAASRPPLSVSAWILASSAETSAISLAAENACNMMHAMTASAMPMLVMIIGAA